MALLTLLVGFGLLALSIFAMVFIAKHGCCVRGVIDALFSAEVRSFGMCYTCYQIEAGKLPDRRQTPAWWYRLHGFCYRSYWWLYHHFNTPEPPPPF
jgi:uncharacterized membrane-anchored protein